MNVKPACQAREFVKQRDVVQLYTKYRNGNGTSPCMAKFSRHMLYLVFVVCVPTPDYPLLDVEPAYVTAEYKERDHRARLVW